ncbi:MAG: aminotransferase class V-fold PLP-dependent enzyme, partial [Gordonibacter sp.]|uniref:aminotransferase class V-fold PLP-dependent enzyme n=1 Tax=Gordonibacter sp. TaxID=1968902 RepID=UPI002FCA0B30
HAGIELAFIPLDACGLVEEGGWRRLLARCPRAVALSASSNVTGLCNDVPRLVREAHAAGAVVSVDCAQSAGHLPLDFAALGADFAAVSAHKMYGPFGIGALLVAPGAEAALHPLLGGGGMIENVDEQGFSCKKAPLCFEAGTPNITGAVGFAAACRFVSGIGLEAAASHGRALCDRAVGLLSAVDGVRIAGGSELGRRASIVSFVLDDVHPHDVAQVLADRKVAVRAGNHCALPLHRTLGMPATVRASFGVYSDTSEVDRLAEGVKQAKEVFSRG